MQPRVLELTDFRNIAQLTIEPDPTGTTVITGPNGTGKTSVLEAMAYLATLQSFRGAPREAMVRRGADRAILRAETMADGAAPTVEAEMSASGRARTMVNRQDAVAPPRPAAAAADHRLLARGHRRGQRRAGRAAPTSSTRRWPWSTPRRPGPPRRWTRSCGSAPPCCARPAAGPSAGRGRHPRRVGPRLADAGKVLVEARERLTAAAGAPIAAAHYARLAGSGDRDRGHPGLPAQLGGAICSPALEANRPADLRRGGQHGRAAPRRARPGDRRAARPAPTPHRGSSGPWRWPCASAIHQLVTARTPLAPILLLDDVFSELDPTRSRALVAELPAGQSILTTAVPLPAGIEVATTVHIDEVGQTP